ncbi:hypothetical protein BN2537_9015 [Streptomyces venezuelae]|nr:hypothetical protein BN2537_9015 [Streptomyces venezuelae]
MAPWSGRVPHPGVGGWSGARVVLDRPLHLAVEGERGQLR